MEEIEKIVKKKNFKIEDVSKAKGQWSHIDVKELMPLPKPMDNPEDEPDWKPISDSAKEKYECGLDDTIILDIPKPANKEEEDKLVQKFLDGLAKLFSEENNWPFLRPLMLSMEHCANCQTCSESCHIYQASGEDPIYRPTCRSEILRRIYNKYIKPGGKYFNKMASW